MAATRARSIWWVVVIALGLGVLAVAAFDPDDGPVNNSERSLELAGEFACPVCGGQSIAESDVPIAREIRAEIRSRLDQGQTDTQIRQYLVGLYGERFDLRPKATGVTGLVWFLPVFVAVLAVAGMAAVFRRWRDEPQARATDADRELVGQAIAGNGAHDGNGEA